MGVLSVSTLLNVPVHFSYHLAILAYSTLSALPGAPGLPQPAGAHVAGLATSPGVGLLGGVHLLVGVPAQETAGESGWSSEGEQGVCPGLEQFLRTGFVPLLWFTWKKCHC